MEWMLAPHAWTLTAQIAAAAIALFGAMLVFIPKRAFFGELSLKDRLLMIAAGMAALACVLNWPVDSGA